MLSPSHLQFRLMTPEAQRAALQRLALRGWDPATISTHTGVPENEVRRQLAGAALIPFHAARRARGRNSAASA